MFIQSNIEAMQTHLNLLKVDSDFNKSMAKISSGLSLPKPMYGPGNFAVANDMEAIYLEYIQGVANVEDAQGLLEVAQTTMLEVNDLLLQMNELAIRAATDTTNDDQRAQLDVEFQRLRVDITNLMKGVRYNEISVWGDSTGISATFDIVFGENRMFTVSIYNMTQSAMGLSNITMLSGGGQISGGGAVISYMVLSQANWASNAIAGMQGAINTMSQNLARIGAQIQEVQAKVDILNEQAVQEKAMEARINELDFAKEMKTFTSMQVVLQASNAMVAQANMKAQMVLQLFGG
jgi:flagellin